MKPNNIKQLGEVADFINGFAFKPSQWGPKGKRIIRIQNLTDKSRSYNRTNHKVPEKYHVNKGDLLVSWSASLGVFDWSEEDTALLNQHIFKVIPDEKKIYKPYLRLALKRSIDSMIKFTHGSTMKHINRGEFLATKIFVPNIEKQKRIAAILDKADAIRRKRQQAIKLADDFLRSVFLDMFGDPVTNPKGWPLGTIRDLVSEVKYGTSKKANEFSSHYPILRMNNITYQGKLDISNLKFIDLDEKEEKKYMVRKGDLLFNRTNSKELVGKTAVYNLETPAAIAGYLIRVRSNDRSNSYYLSGYLNSKHGKATLCNMCKNIIGMANINAQELQDIKILMPPIELQNKYSSIVKAVEEKKDTTLNQRKQNEDLMKSLIQRAFHGEL